MMQAPRYLHKAISQDLGDRMAFIGGPRQVGKTTLAKMLLKQADYFTWDSKEDRIQILRESVYSNQKELILDEVHKYRNWRSMVKGIYDKHRDHTRIIVTGSARLDVFRKGGDSLLGRYHYFRLHPFSLPELDPKCGQLELETLYNFGGFPEPLFKQNAQFLRRWHLERIERITSQDLYDLAVVKDLSLLQVLVELLIDRAAGSLSIKSLQEDLQVSPHTVERWIGLLEAVYFCYRLQPFSVKNRARSIKKTQKVYLWDWSQVQTSGAKFENMVGSHLLKLCHYIQDTEGFKMELRYIQDADKREIDFVVLKSGKPMFAVECKTGEKSLQPSLKYYQDRYKIPRVYQVHMGKKDFGRAEDGGRILPFHKFCVEEGLV